MRNRLRPSLNAHTPGPERRPKNASVKPSLFTSPAASDEMQGDVAPVVEGGRRQRQRRRGRVKPGSRRDVGERAVAVVAQQTAAGEHVEIAVMIDVDERRGARGLRAGRREDRGARVAEARPVAREEPWACIRQDQEIRATVVVHVAGNDAA